VSKSEKSKRIEHIEAAEARNEMAEGEDARKKDYGAEDGYSRKFFLFIASGSIDLFSVLWAPTSVR
jgi:hypothetical protein